MDKLSAPQITIYTRLIDNITKEEISGFQPVNKKSTLGFGPINGISGGESPIIVEFDIWNNEPAIGGGLFANTVLDAVDYKFTAWDSPSCNSSANISSPIKDGKSTPYIRAKCVSIDNNSKFFPIAGAQYFPTSEIDSYTGNSNVLLGHAGGDHVKFQTKIVIPPNTSAGINNFVFEFSYNYL